MKHRFEHKTQPVARFSVFLSRMGRYGFFSFGLIVFSVGIGVAGYAWLGGLGWVDSFHMACMILTGMGPVANMETDAAKLFSSFYALYSGVAFLSIMAVFFAPAIHRLLHILHVTQDRERE